MDIAKQRRSNPLALGLIGLLTGAVSVYDYLQVKAQLDALNADSELLIASVGDGLYVCIGGSIAILVGAALIAGERMKG